MAEIPAWLGKVGNAIMQIPGVRPAVELGKEHIADPIHRVGQRLLTPELGLGIFDYQKFVSEFKTSLVIDSKKAQEAFKNTRGAFQEYDIAHQKNTVKQLCDIELPDKIKLSTKLDQQQLEQLESIFKANDDNLKNAEKSFETHLDKCTEILNTKSNALDEGLLDELYRGRAYALQSIETKQTAETKKLEELLKKPALSTIKAHEEALKKQLQTQHEAEKKAFNDAATKAIEALHPLAQQRRAHIVALALLSKRYSKTKALVEKLGKEAAKERLNKAGGPTTISGSVTIQFEDIDITQLGTFTYLTGCKISMNPQGGIIASEISTDPAKAKASLQLIALLHRASGKDTIKFNVKHNDPAEAYRMARHAYHACILAGFEPDKITLKVNGTEKKVGDLLNPMEGQGDNKKPILPGEGFDPNQYSQYSSSKYFKDKIQALQREATTIVKSDTTTHGLKT